MSKGLALLCVAAGGLIAAVALRLVPEMRIPVDAPTELVAAGGAVLGLMGLMSLARDHRVSDVITSLVLLALAALSGWLTFFAPAGTVNRYVPFIPAEVNEALSRLLFGVGAAACIGMALWGVRRLLR